MKIIKIIVSIFICGITCASCQDRSALKITLEVADDVGIPVDVATIETDLFDRWQPGEGFGKDLYKKLQAITADSGLAVLEAESSRCALVLRAKKSGYYWAGAEFKSINTSKGQWQPWNPTIKMELKRVLNPIPLIAKKVIRNYADYVQLPGTGIDVGFDLERGDWVTPHGAGTTADILFRMEGKTEDAFALYDTRLHITFSHPQDGLVLHETKPVKGSGLRLPYLAPEAGYASEWLQRKARVPGATTGVLAGIPQVIDEAKPTENYFLRLRTKVDGDGKVISAHYAKVQGGFLWYPSGLVKFQYCFNPTANDRNLEFDTTRNLLRVLPGQEVKDP
ncbi:hypothetical protein EI77_02297 [Prosthecobacter fusiformis]|uniref:Uncharacterized protein n=1 Tax=Prosthecobacter fusiformis TaxID=48464 RepID=A0A4R7S1T2_9BACT|nr:hypothetical protein [Prosthecobacter fusiformis]TDU71175.1 hypothetical protein EI77_02297 [Prosthecobacter fusiformis]